MILARTRAVGLAGTLSFSFLRFWAGSPSSVYDQFFVGLQATLFFTSHFTLLPPAFGILQELAFFYYSLCLKLAHENRTENTPHAGGVLYRVG